MRNTLSTLPLGLRYLSVQCADAGTRRPLYWLKVYCSLMMPTRDASPTELIGGEAFALCINIGIHCILLDKFAAGTYVVAHEHREDVVGIGSIVERYLLQ